MRGKEQIVSAFRGLQSWQRRGLCWGQKRMTQTGQDAGSVRVSVRFLRRHDRGQGQVVSLGGVAETFVARNRGPRVQAMEIWSGWAALL